VLVTEAGPHVARVPEGLNLTTGQKQIHGPIPALTPFDC
jgi:hypothetical protein